MYTVSKKAEIYDMMTRKELITFLTDYIAEKQIDISTIRNILPQYSLQRNLNHSAVRIARELGFTVK